MNKGVLKQKQIQNTIKRICFSIFAGAMIVNMCVIPAKSVFAALEEMAIMAISSINNIYVLIFLYGFTQQLYQSTVAIVLIGFVISTFCAVLCVPPFLKKIEDKRATVSAPKSIKESFREYCKSSGMQVTGNIANMSLGLCNHNLLKAGVSLCKLLLNALTDWVQENLAFLMNEAQSLKDQTNLTVTSQQDIQAASEDSDSTDDTSEEKSNEVIVCDSEKDAPTDQNQTAADKDKQMEQLWLELENVPFDEDEDGRLCLAEEWHDFPAGTDRDEIWHWFDENHSKGVAWLLYEFHV